MKKRERERQIVEQRMGGMSPHEIAREQKCSIARVNEAIARFADSVIDEKVRKNTLALELTRLDRLQSVFFDQAMNGDVQSGALVEKIISRRCALLGLPVQHNATELKIIDATPTKQIISTDRIEAALRELKEQAEQHATDDDDAADDDLPSATH